MDLSNVPTELSNAIQTNLHCGFLYDCGTLLTCSVYAGGIIEKVNSENIRELKSGTSDDDTLNVVSLW